ncbi:unnamed protein product [Hydatigera taeniaeformis]|uniref:Uncharacterized protein n=1 Tax=Hydatigena taeniaeformis TaxID=6205 RepID=A0A0R3XD15_HYDTA|nr:unnamed protein product [Hydatigera taeniaeformis]
MHYAHGDVILLTNRDVMTNRCLREPSTPFPSASLGHLTFALPYQAIRPDLNLTIALIGDASQVCGFHLTISLTMMEH